MQMLDAPAPLLVTNPALKSGNPHHRLQQRSRGQIGACQVEAFFFSSLARCESIASGGE